MNPHRSDTPTYKRNQLDEALHALFTGSSASAYLRLDQPVPSAFRTRIKRLIELDRALGSSPGSSFAFHDAAAPGKGHEVCYTDYRAFNVAIALELVRFGCKQREVVEKIIELEPKFRRAFDRVASTHQTLRGASVTSDLAAKLPTGSTRRGDGRKPDPKIYLLVSQIDRTFTDAADTRSVNSIEAEIALGSDDLEGRLRALIPDFTFGLFVLEISVLAATLRELLHSRPAIKRGR